MISYNQDTLVEYRGGGVFGHCQKHLTQAKGTFIGCLSGAASSPLYAFQVNFAKKSGGSSE